MFWVIVVIVLVVGVAMAVSSANAKQKAKEAYERALQKLKSDPTNSDLRQRTLALGRAYSSLMRDSKGNTVFDEVALLNDINAACAGATQRVIPEVNQASATESVESRLRKLQSLRDSGLIDAEDFNRRKLEIVNQI